MVYDFKKVDKSWYFPTQQPQIITIGPMQYLSIQGEGDPNVQGGSYQRGIEKLYAMAYTLKMSKKGDYQIQGYFDYVVPPLEGLWYQKGIAGFDYQRKDLLTFISLLRLPQFIQKKDVQWAAGEVARKKGLNCSDVEIVTLDEGLCVQALHIGAYDSEPVTVEAMHAFVQEQDCVLDFSESRLHHEIYLSDPRKCSEQKLKTVIRHPIAKVR